MFDSLYFKKKKTKENDKMLNMFILGARFTDVCYIMICTLLKFKKKKNSSLGLGGDATLWPHCYCLELKNSEVL